MNVRRFALPEMEPGYVYILVPTDETREHYETAARIAGVTKTTVEAAEDIANARGNGATYAYLEADGDNHRLICPDVIKLDQPGGKDHLSANQKADSIFYGEPERSTLDESRAEAYNEAVVLEGIKTRIDPTLPPQRDKFSVEHGELVISAGSRKRLDELKTGDVIEGKSVGRDFIAEYDALVKALARRHIDAEVELKSAQQSRDENGAVILKLRDRVFELEIENQKLKDQAALGTGATNTAMRYADEARHLETALRKIRDTLFNCESGDHTKALIGMDAARQIATAALKGYTA